MPINLALWLRWGRIATLTVLFIVLSEIIMFFTKPAIKRDRYSKIARLWGRITLWGNKVSIENKELIPWDEPVIFASNHQSNFDVPLLWALLPVPFRWIGKAELLGAPLLGRAMRTSGAIAVDRGVKGKSYKAMHTAANCVKDGSSVIIFPEGTFGAKGGKMRPFKKGITILAKETGAFIVPLTIFGTGKLNPPDSYELNYGPIGVIVHPPIGPESREGKPVDQWLAQLKEIMGEPLVKKEGA